MGYAGLFFIVYGVWSKLAGQPWPPLENIAPRASSALTILATLLTATSVYHASMNTPPERISRIATAPTVILLCALALAVLVVQSLDPVIVNGFALMGMAGAMMRIQPNPHYTSSQNAAFDKQAHIRVVTDFIVRHHSEHIDECVEELSKHKK